MEYPKFKVCCRCFTFNQTKYITDAMNGFTMQQTSFPFVCCIVDDASTDGEQDVIRKYVEDNFDFSDGSVAFHKETDYAHITYAQHKTNKNCYFAVLYLKENHYSQRKPKLGYLSEWRDMCEYEALCEGDDYWIDPMKIQIQVDYMEQHPECNLVHSRFDYVDVENNVIPTPNIKLYKDLENNDALKNGYIWQNHLIFSTPILFCTCLYRRSALEGEQAIIDHGLFMTCARKGTVHFINEKTSCYRINPAGMMRSNQSAVLNKIRNAIFIQLYYYCNSDFKTDCFYRHNIKTRLYISEAIISSILAFSKIEIENKYSKLLYIIGRRPLNAILLPFALISKMLRKFGRVNIIQF